MTGELYQLLADIRSQQEVLKQEAHERGVSQFQLQTPDGNWPYLPLLVAEANTRLALVQLGMQVPQGAPCVCGRPRPCGGPHDCGMM